MTFTNSTRAGRGGPSDDVLKCLTALGVPFDIAFPNGMPPNPCVAPSVEQIRHCSHLLEPGDTTPCQHGGACSIDDSSGLRTIDLGRTRRAS